MPTRDWKHWMRLLGGAIRKSRELVGLSQAQLGALSGVSQGAISRLETGRGVSSPLVVVLRVLSVLQKPMEALPQQLVPEGAELLFTLSRSGRRETAAEWDSGLFALIEEYHELTPTQRAGVLNVAMSLASEFKAQRDDIIAR